jgi:hypothetical protein
MAIITRAQFAKVAGVNRVQMTKLVASGTLTGRKDIYINTAAPKNAAYLKKHVRHEDGSTEDRASLLEQKTLSEIRRNNETADEKLQKRLERMGVLVDGELFRKRLAVLDGEIKRRFLEMPQRAGPDLHAKAQSMGAREWELELEKEISEALTAVLVAVQDARA